MSQNAAGELRTVHLPPEKLDICGFCGKTTNLRLCSSCGEQQYCSPACQKEDWRKHKISCGKTDRIDLASFYPFLACFVDACHIHPEMPQHPAIRHTILNSPNPGTHTTAFPDGSTAKLVILGETIPLQETASEKWWPTAASPKVRSKLFRRISREGYLLPILVSLCIGLLAEVYTTTTVSASDSPDGKLKRRVRFQYHSSPISDFGIVKGKAEVKGQDRLAYFNFSNGTFQKGQDPDDHYWFYFITIRGEEFILDCGMFTFNFCFIVPTEPYRQKILPPTSLVPAYFRDRTQARHAPVIHQVEHRFSFLHNKALHQAVAHSGRAFRPVDAKTICEFMESIAGRTCSAIEKDLVMKWSINSCMAIGITLEDRAWVKWPKDPALAVEPDPGEMDESNEDDEAWWKYMRKWNRKYKRGDISRDALRDAFCAWNDSHPARSG